MILEPFTGSVQTNERHDDMTPPSGELRCVHEMHLQQQRSGSSVYLITERHRSVGQPGVLLPFHSSFHSLAVATEQKPWVLSVQGKSLTDGNWFV